MRSSACSTLAAVLLTAGAALAIEPARQPHQPLGNGELLLTWNNTMVSNRFGASSRSVQWIDTGAGDGQYIFLSDAGLVLENIATGENQTLVASSLFPPDLYTFWVRPDTKKVLFATDYTKGYRHSYNASYHVLDVESGELTPLVADQSGDIQYAEFAPVGDAIVFVRGNNLFLSKGPGNATQITTDGGPDLFHGVPDWVYEEEIFGDSKTAWFSPDGEYLAFLSFNETGVETYRIPYYMHGESYPSVYPEELELRYPKVGTTNPTVSLTLLAIGPETTTDVAIDAYPADDLIIGEVVWVTSAHESVLYRALNRVQDHEKLVVLDVPSGASTTVRERDGTDGWLEPSSGLQYVGPLAGSADNASYYVDVSDESGWNHIYLHSVQGGEPKALTSGEWEVSAVLKIDTARQLVYYQSTEHHSTERHLYSVSYATGEKKALVDDTVPAYWSASFSSNATYYILSYQGPDVPYQELYAANDTATALRVITSNQALWDRLQEYNLPNITYFELEHPSGFRLNVMQRLPPNFDPAKKYPSLYIPYGGPAAQEVHKRFSPLNWKAYVTSDPELEFITYTVDNRGTGYRGRAFRSTVASQLGTLEAEDQVWAAEQIAARFPYIDADKVGIFGWSYGGFLAAKVLETDSGAFSTGLIVAPVTDWRLYDSMYTERYMKTPETNEAGYNKTAVRNVDGFKNVAGGFSVYHGTGDDNVHYQNAAALIDLLVGAGLSPDHFRWLSFTDSDHSIVYNGASTFIYKALTEALFKEKRRVLGEEITHQWTRRALSADRQAKFHFE